MVKNLSSSIGAMGLIPSQGIDYMYKCEYWTIKKDEHPRIDAFELW